MKKKKKPELDLKKSQQELIETVYEDFKKLKSIRAAASQNNISHMKARKLLITGGYYSCQMSEEIGEMLEQGMKVKDIAASLETTTANISSYIP